MASTMTDTKRPNTSVSPAKSALVVAGICLAIAVGDALLYKAWSASSSAPGVIAVYNVLILIVGAHYKRPAFVVMALAGFAVAIVLALSGAS